MVNQIVRDRGRAHLLVVGKGTVGGQLLAQLPAAQAAIAREHGATLSLAGVAGRRAQVFDPDGIDALTARARLAGSSSPTNLYELLERLGSLSTPILVDCTAADGMDALYRAAFELGVHVVTANKKPLATATGQRDALFAAARRAGVAFRYETTVGAGLPIIETVKNLVRTGDRVLRVEGSLSGTLGFLANEVSRGERLSVALRTARARGYTEPHPRDDLDGTDVARKVLILARELGLAIEPEEVALEPFGPTSLLTIDDVDRFLAAVAGQDDAFGHTVSRFQDDGFELRYLASIDPGADAGAPPRVRVGAVGVPADHPARRLRGTEAFVAIYSERYREHPLVVQGPGAGGAVTAGGVLADVLAIARRGL